MATTYTAQPNQSTFDVAVAATGSMEACWQFCQDNGLGITDDVVVGVAYVVSDAALALGNAAVVTALNQRNIVVGTLASPPAYTVPFVAEGGGEFESESGETFVTE